MITQHPACTSPSRRRGKSMQIRDADDASSLLLSWTRTFDDASSMLLSELENRKSETSRVDAILALAKNVHSIGPSSRMERAHSVRSAHKRLVRGRKGIEIAKNDGDGDELTALFSAMPKTQRVTEDGIGQQLLSHIQSMVLPCARESVSCMSTDDLLAHRYRKLLIQRALSRLRGAEGHLKACGVPKLGSDISSDKKSTLRSRSQLLRVLNAIARAAPPELLVDEAELILRKAHVSAALPVLKREDFDVKLALKLLRVCRAALRPEDSYVTFVPRER